MVRRCRHLQRSGNMNENESKGSKIVINSFDDWSVMLSLFAKASGLIGSLYLPTGKRILGPYNGVGFGKYLLETTNFEETGTCHEYESSKVKKACSTNNFKDLKFENALSVKLLPIYVYDEVVAVVVYGWTFENFPDPLDCNRLALVLEIGDMLFWQAARLQSPTSKEKMATFEGMLELLCSTLVQQLIYLHQAKLNSRFKDELLAVVSHELKTPLTAILLRIQMLKRSSLGPEQILKFANSMEASAKIQARLIEDLLDAAKIITGKFAINPDVTDLKDIVHAAVETIKEAADKKEISIISSGLDDTYPFVGDTMRLQQVIWNILSNSVKFTQPGGSIYVKVTQNISSYVIRLSDNGPGIEQSFIPYLFDKFAQHESKIGKPSSGLGIGLSLVKTIVELHLGSIEVESPGLGQGTTFEIKLPRENQICNDENYASEKYAFTDSTHRH